MLEPPSDPPKSVRLLIVEDESIIAINLKETLLSLGYQVVGMAATGENAIAAATAHQPDLVLMDIRLKGEIDGVQAAEQIWQQLHIPVIYVTGHSDKSTLERAKVTAPFGYILKPVKEKELYVTIETALQRYEREFLLSTVLQGMGDGVIVVDTNLQVKYINLRAEEMTGWKQEEAREQLLTNVFNLIEQQSYTPVIAQLVNHALNQTAPVYFDQTYLLIGRTGISFPVSNSIASIQDRAGKLAGLVIVFRDITQRLLAEERNQAIARSQQLERQMNELQQLNQLKEDFLVTISHELRTPIANIKTVIHLLESVLDKQGVLEAEPVETSQGVNRYLNILKEQCEQELRLVNDLLEMRAVEAETCPLEVFPVLLQDWLPHLLEGFQDRLSQQEQQLEVTIAHNLPPLITELHSINRIISELLHNACKYTPPKGKVVVTATAIALDYPNQPRGVEICIFNSGVEIAATELNRIFEPFYRIPNGDPWRYGGTGLGLALVKKLVHRLRGEITVTSQSQSVTFLLRFPENLSMLPECQPQNQPKYDF